MKCLITAGPTREFIDPVRFVSNPSSGKMGYALATAAASRGWEVDLVTGPVSLLAPEGVCVHPVVSGDEMYQVCSGLFPGCALLIMCAAICDMRPVKTSASKQKKDQLDWCVQFEPVVDILKTLSLQKTHQTVIGFAAETENLESYAHKKLIEKQLDWIVANDVSRQGSGFEADTNSVLLLSKHGNRHSLGPCAKAELAHEILNIVHPCT